MNVNEITDNMIIYHSLCAYRDRLFELRWKKDKSEDDLSDEEVSHLLDMVLSLIEEYSLKMTQD